MQREILLVTTYKTRYDDQRIRTAASNIRSTIREVFGENSPEFQENKYHNWDYAGVKKRNKMLVL
jgi:hypothetical protein